MIDGVHTADLIVVGAGPSGCAAALTAARAGLDVVLLDKASAFPRHKVCGDALTPRAVAALEALGLTPGPGWHPARGMAVYGERDAPYLFDWPATSGRPTTAYTVPRDELDAFLLEAATGAGARVSLGSTVTGLLTEAGRAVGVALAHGSAWHAPVVIDAAGASSRLADAAGMPRLAGRPMGVAVRGYATGAPGLLTSDSPEPWLHSWLALRGPDGARMAGYGWVFPLGDGRYNVGVGQLSTGPGFRRTDYKATLRAFLDTLPAGWNLRWDEAAPAGASPIMGAALPMGIDRRVLYRRGVLAVGDAAGLVSPFDGEGVGYGLDSGRWAGEAVVAAHSQGFGTSAAEARLQGYHHRVKAELGRYFAAGNLFARLMGHPAALSACLRFGLPRRWVMRPVNKLMSNLIAAVGGPLDDRVMRSLLRLLPSA